MQIAKTMLHPAGLYYFRKFARRERAHHSVDFWLAVDAFKKLPQDDQEWGAKAQHIATTYVFNTRMLPMLTKLRKRDVKLAMDPTSPEPMTPSLFDDVQTEVLDSLIMGTYARFKSSKLFPAITVSLEVVDFIVNERFETWRVEYDAVCCLQRSWRMVGARKEAKRAVCRR